MITSWSAKLNEAFPFLAKFAETQGQDVNLAGGGITLVPLFIGIIMTFDNIFGVIFQPTFGKLSDRTHSKMGKRRPFIIFGAPVSAFLFAVIPWVALS
ncbi:MAG: MFS transporter, partial [Clostridia bacterium]|nr:MFS transporter [Clostridia bacterium]